MLGWVQITSENEHPFRANLNAACLMGQGGRRGLAGRLLDSYPERSSRVPRSRVVMKRIKECLRLHLECGRSQREIARALDLSLGAVNEIVASI